MHAIIKSANHLAAVKCTYTDKHTMFQLTFKDQKAKNIGLIDVMR